LDAPLGHHQAPIWLKGGLTCIFWTTACIFWTTIRWRVGDQRKATREVIAGTAIEPHPPTALAGDDADAIVLDLDQI